MRKKIIIFSFLSIFSLILAGCNFPGRATPTSQVDMLNTAAAQTIQAQQTRIMQTDQAEPQGVTPSPTPTLEATTEPGVPTDTPEPTTAPTAKPTATQSAECYQASFVAETIPDGTDFDPGESFTKTWSLKNAGSCKWEEDFDVVFVDGIAMNAPASQQLTTGTVEPGETVKISMELKAPLAAGTHRGDFKLRNANGALFGVGNDDKTFWVEIEVLGTFFDFTENACDDDVTWKSGAGELPCPGEDTDTDGWVQIIDKPTLENGAVDNEPGIKVQPEMVTDGWIRGIYPEISVTEGVFFKAIVGCYGKADCNVKFKLNYKLEGETEKTLATWQEVQDNKFNRVKVDLSSLAGEEVQFILLVEANGSPTNDRALWFGPRIEP